MKWLITSLILAFVSLTTMPAAVQRATGGESPDPSAYAAPLAPPWMSGQAGDTAYRSPSVAVPALGPIPPAVGNASIGVQADANNVGIGADGVAGVGDFDMLGNSYSADSLQAQGIAAGQAITAGGVTFDWPGAATGQPDNVVAQGQVITPTTPVSGTALAVLGASDHGAIQGTGSVTYSDGTTQSFTLGLSDWTLDGGRTARPSYGNGIAASLPYRNTSQGGREVVQTYLFYAAIPLRGGQVITRVTLPTTAGPGHLHVFALTVTSQPLEQLDQAQLAVMGGLSVRAGAHAAQSVTAGVSGALTQVTLPFCTPIKDSVVDLTVLTETPLQSSTASLTFARSYSDCAWYTFTFAQPIAVSAGEVVILAVEPRRGEAPLWGTSGGPGDPYPGGNGVWFGRTVNDFGFQTYVQPPLTG
jgi:hypothetical protein